MRSCSNLEVEIELEFKENVKDWISTCLMNTFFSNLSLYFSPWQGKSKINLNSVAGGDVDVFVLEAPESGSV